MADIIKYNPELRDMVESLYLSQKTPFYDTPALGFIAFDSATPIAAGFLRMVEGGFAQIDGLVSNAGLSSQMRNDGISTVVNALIKSANDMKLKGIYAHTTNESVARRASDLGFRMEAGILMALPLMTEKQDRG